MTSCYSSAQHPAMISRFIQSKSQSPYNGPQDPLWPNRPCSFPSWLHLLLFSPLTHLHWPQLFLKHSRHTSDLESLHWLVSLSGKHFLQLYSLANSLTSFRALLKCHFLQRPSLTPLLNIQSTFSTLLYFLLLHFQTLLPCSIFLFSIALITF